jgi:hypothetical protein
MGGGKLILTNLPYVINNCNFEIKTMSESQLTSAPQEKKKSGRRNILLLLLLLLLLLGGASGYLGLQYLSHTALIAEQEKQVAELEADYKQAMAELEKAKEEYEMLAAEKMVSDSLASARLSEIDRLMEELKNAKSRGLNAGGGAKYRQLKEERDRLMGDLRKLKADYANLVGIRDSILVNLNTSEEVRRQLTDTNQLLTEKINIAKQLKIYRAELIGVRERRNGDAFSEDRLKKCNRLEIEFDVQENELAEPGERTAYVVIYTPGKVTLNDNPSDNFDYMGSKKLFSVRKTFTYSNKPQMVVAEYDIKDDLPEGLYTAEVYLDGVLCYTTKAKFRK